MKNRLTSNTVAHAVILRVLARTGARFIPKSRTARRAAVSKCLSDEMLNHVSRL